MFSECYGRGIYQKSGAQGRSWLCCVELGEAKLGLEVVHLSMQSKIIGQPDE